MAVERVEAWRSSDGTMYPDERSAIEQDLILIATALLSAADHNKPTKNQQLAIVDSMVERRSEIISLLQAMDPLIVAEATTGVEEDAGATTPLSLEEQRGIEEALARMVSDPLEAPFGVVD